jgi:hypothetical protein
MDSLLALAVYRLQVTGLTIEFTQANAANERVPLGWGEVEHPASRVLAVADPDRVIGEASDLYAIGVVRAQ